MIDSEAQHDLATYDIGQQDVAVTLKEVNLTIARCWITQFEGSRFGLGSVKEPVSYRFLDCYILPCIDLSLAFYLLVQQPAMNQLGLGAQCKTLPLYWQSPGFRRELVWARRGTWSFRAKIAWTWSINTFNY